MRKYFLLPLFPIFLVFEAQAQQVQYAPQSAADSLKREILALQTDVETIQLNLGKSHQRFKWGMLTATIGYTVTIAGGQLLANGDTNAGRALLYTGGGIGIVGTAVLLDSFRYLGRAAGKKGRKGKR